MSDRINQLKEGESSNDSLEQLLDFAHGKVRIIESQNSLSWKGSLKAVQSNTPPIIRDIFKYIRLLRALCKLTLNVSREGTSTTSLGNLFSVTVFVLKDHFKGKKKV